MEVAGVMLSWVLPGGHRGQGAQPSPPQTPLPAASPLGEPGTAASCGARPRADGFSPHVADLLRRGGAQHPHPSAGGAGSGASPCSEQSGGNPSHLPKCLQRVAPE